MPTKWPDSISFITFSDDIIYTVSGIPALDEVTVAELPEPIKIINNTEFECTGRLHIEGRQKLAFLSVIYGREITNNWLKMHGYPMVRGRYLK